MDVYSRLSPFTSQTKKVIVPVGLTISDIMDFSGVGKKLRKYCKVTVSGHEITADKWKSVRPKDHADVRIYATPQGGGGGGGSKGVLGVVLVAMAIVLTVYTGGISNALAGALTVGTGEFGGGILIGGLTGTMITSAVGYAAVGLAVVGLSMISQSMQPKLGTLSSTSGSTSETLKITGSSNSSNPFGVIPKVYGKHKVYPLVCANTYTEQQGDDEYLNMLLTFGKGPLTISDLKIGTNPIEWYDDVEYEFREGRDTDTPLSLYKNSVLQDGYSVLLEKDVEVIRRSRVDADEISFDIQFTQGLANFTNSGSTTARTATFTYAYRKVGDVDWTEITENNTITDSATSAFSVGTRVVLPETGQYDIRIIRKSVASSTLSAVDAARLTTLRTFKYVTPVNEPNISLLAIRIKATSQLNGVIDDLNAIVYGEVKTWDGSGLTDYIHTRNPAWAYLDVLIGMSSKKNVNLSRIDMDRLLEWSGECDVLDSDGNPMYQFDAVIDYETTAFELLNDITSAARASFGMRAGRFSIVQDKKQTITRDIYTPRNTSGFKGYKVMLDMPHAIRAKFVSPDIDWEQDEIIVYADGYDSTTATEFEEIEWFGVVNSGQVYRLTRYFLACLLLRPETFSVSVSLDGFVVERGDLVEMAHDVPLLGGAPALVKGVTKVGTDITQFIIDDYVQMETGKVYGLRLRDLEGTTVTHEVVTVPGETNTLTLVIPEPETSVSKKQSVVAFGEYSTETSKMIVQKIERGEDLTAKITLLPYNDAIYSADTDIIPAYDPSITRVTNEYVPSAVQSLLVSESYSGGQNYEVSLTLSWKAPQEGGSFTYEIYKEVRGSYELQDITASKTWVYPKNVYIGDSHSFAVIAVSQTGKKLPVSQATSIRHSVTGVVPPDVISFDADVIGTGIVLSWEISSDTYVYDYEIKHSSLLTGATWGSAVDVQIVSAPTKTVTLPVQVGTYLIKARDFRGLESTNALTVVNGIPASDDINVIQTITESPDWLGIKTDTVVVDGKLRIGETVFFDDVIDVDSILDFDILDGKIVSYGSYNFEDTFDLGAVYTSTLSSSIAVTGLDINDLFDDYVTIDTRTSWDTVVPSKYSVNMMVRTTDDDPTGTPVWSDWKKFIAGNYRTRAFQFRLDLYSLQEGITPLVSDLSVTVDMPDRIERFSNITSGLATKTITFNSAFWNATDNPTINITANDMATGDYYLITSKSNTGFDITFYDNLDVIVSREFDVLAAGFGREI